MVIDRRRFIKSSLISMSLIPVTSQSANESNLKINDVIRVKDFILYYKDNDIAFEKAIELSKAEGKPIYIDNGIYIFKRGKVFSDSVNVIGAGRGAVRLVFEPACKFGFKFLFNSHSGNVNLSSFSIVVKGESSASAIILDGCGIIDKTGKLEGRTELKSSIFDVDIRGFDDFSSWHCGIEITSLGWVDIDKVNITGRRLNNLLSGIGIWIKGTGWPVEFYLTRLRLYNLEYGIVGSDYCEGVVINDFNLVNVFNGISFTREFKKIPSEGEKKGVFQINITNGHINAISSAIILSYSSYGTIDNVFIILDDKSVVEYNRAIKLDNSSYVSISNLKLGIWRTSKIIKNTPMIFLSSRYVTLNTIFINTKGFTIDSGLIIVNSSSIIDSNILLDGVNSFK